MSQFIKDNDIRSGAGEWDEKEHPRDEDGRFISISEFRFLEKHKDTKKHPAHIYARNNEDKVKYLQLTHSKHIKGRKIPNIEMEKNPNPNDLKKAYFVPESKDGVSSDFGKLRKKWSLSKADEIKMKKYRDEIEK